MFEIDLIDSTHMRAVTAETFTLSNKYANCYVLDTSGSITHLRLHQPQLLDFSEIYTFTELIELEIRDCSIGALTSDISRLSKLKSLHFVNCQLSTLPESIAELSNLEKLTLCESGTRTLPAAIGQLAQLTDLELSKNKINDLPESIGQLAKLTTLNLDNNQIQQLPKTIVNLKSLRDLSVKRNQLHHLPEEIGRLANLQILVLNENQLKLLPRSIGQLSFLSELHIENNSISQLPSSMVSLSQMAFLYIDGNPLINNIKLLLDQLSTQDQLAYLIEISNEDTDPLNEAKVLMVGEERTGKTSLVKRIRNKPYQSNEASTQGIDIERHTIKSKLGELEVNIWDFAGQEITHQTHQFFLSTGSVYVYVIDSQKEDDGSGIYHWLNVIRSNAKSSPIIVVCNKHDINPNFEFDLNRYQDEFNIVDVINVSAETCHNIDKLLNILEKAVRSLTDIDFPLPPNWLAVKNELELMAQEGENQRDFIEAPEYEQICNSFGIRQYALQSAFLNILNQIGTIVTYCDNKRLDVMQIINPLWVTEGVYKIIRSNTLGENAILSEDEYRRIFGADDRYKKARHFQWLIDLLVQFELAFRLDERKILIPSRLRPVQPNFDLNHYRTGLNFRYEYRGILKKNVITQFIVKMRDYIDTSVETCYWKRGVFLSLRDAKAVVIADENKKIVDIAIASCTSRAPLELLSIIRHVIRSINGANLIAEEKVPLIVDGEIVGYAGYDYLAQMQDDGMDIVPLQVSKDGKYTYQKFNLAKLLNGYRQEEPWFDFRRLTQDLIAGLSREMTNFIKMKNNVEDDYNDSIRTALRHMGYVVADQSRGGRSQTGKSPGVRDLVILHNEFKTEECIIESLVLHHFNRESIDSHYQKLTVNYNPHGHALNFMLVFAKTSNFEGLWQNYFKHFRAQKMNDAMTRTHGNKSNLKVGLTEFKKREVCHIMMNLGQ